MKARSRPVESSTFWSFLTVFSSMVGFCVVSLVAAGMVFWSGMFCWAFAICFTFSAWSRLRKFGLHGSEVGAWGAPFLLLILCRFMSVFLVLLWVLSLFSWVYMWNSLPLIVISLVALCFSFYEGWVASRMGFSTSTG